MEGDSIYSLFIVASILGIGACGGVCAWNGETEEARVQAEGNKKNDGDPLRRVTIEPTSLPRQPSRKILPDRNELAKSESTRSLVDGEEQVIHRPGET
jgi:hypothetical protein